MTTSADSTKAAVLKLFARGEITLSEAATLAGVSRQSMAYWTRDIDWPKARAGYLDRLARRIATSRTPR